MKSKITIDLAEDNQPVILINYVPSEDVRDKMIKRFLETFGYESRWARMTFQSLPDGSISTMRPIPPNELEYDVVDMKSFIAPKFTISGDTENVTTNT